jgi:hypothetical protein
MSEPSWNACAVKRRRWNAIAPQVGGPKTVAAAPELMVALGLSLPEGV